MTPTYNIDLEHLNDCIKTQLVVSCNEYNGYKVIRYKKDKLLGLGLGLGLYRSVIMSPDGRLVCFSPPKSYDINDMNENDNNITAEEWVEGTMINAFYDDINSEWLFATKSMILCKYDTSTFYEMLLDVLCDIGLDCNNLKKDYCYSFVMQHPKNIISIPTIVNKSLWLISAYAIENNKDKCKAVVRECDRDEECIYLLHHCHMNQPHTYREDTMNNIIKTYASKESAFNVCGVMFRNEMGKRWKMRSPVYEELRHVGGALRMLYVYIHLKKRRALNEYKDYKTQVLFARFQADIDNYIKRLHENYSECYIKKKKSVKEYEYMYRNDMMLLHDVYKTNFIYITREFVKSFVDKKSVLQLVKTIHKFRCVQDQEDSISSNRS